ASYNANSFLGTPIDMTTSAGSLGLNGHQVDYYFDGTSHQAIWRTDRYLNLEINGLVQPIYNNPGCFSATLLGGFRYFRFQDTLTYGSASNSFNFGDDGGAQAAYLQSNVTNNLFGGQIGTLLNFAITPTWGLYAIPKAGVFGNQINITNQLYSGNGAVAYDRVSGQLFNYHASQVGCSLLGEFDAGAYWWMTPNCQLYAGWRVIGVSQVALADNQFLPYIADYAGFQTVKANGDLILTGAFAGLSFAF
ncbi:MAG TPA: BBP7 family outer membrane beta-barrel protein, partial [Pirellulales bacterium]|nr:BBP7 family outer membrane beta-barrel protein [Pirellulales bacterium]